MTQQHIFIETLDLHEFDKLCDEIHIPLPKGAGHDVDTIGEEVVEKYGEDKLKNIAKLNFKNYDKAKKSIEK